MKKLLYVLLLISSINVWAQTDLQIEPENVNFELGRPSVALVLSGAGPRGFAHIPIIELIEELGIPIDLVLGTSSGAIVGGLYASGYSGKELAQTVLDIDWTELLQDSTNNLLSSALGPHSSTAHLFTVELDSNLSLNLGAGVLTGQYVYSKLKALTVKIPSYIDFDDLPIPYRASAVNLITGEYTLLDKGDIAEAMRSSMTLPGVFEPFPIDGNYYLDGFIKNTLPVEAVKNMGYDIIIAVEIADKMAEDVSDISSNPVSVLNQVLLLQQESVSSKEYTYADLVLFPDLTEFGSADYAFSKEIYKKGQQEAEKFRSALMQVRSKIFSEHTEDFEKTVSPSDTMSYKELPYIYVEDISLKNIYSFDTNTILKEFEKIKNKPITDKEIEMLLEKAYQTGNYIMITSRIDVRNSQTILELDFYQKEFSTVQFGAVQTFEGTLSNSSSWEIISTATIQVRNLLNRRGVLSIQGSILNKTSLELMYFQPLGNNGFLRSKVNAFRLIDIELPGFSQTQIIDSYIQELNAFFAFGVFFSPEHKIINELGFHVSDTSQALTNIQNNNSNKPAYSLDISARYIFNSLDYLMLPTDGFYSDISAMGVVPINEAKSPVLFDVIKVDIAKAISFNEHFSIGLNGFLGTNISGQLLNHPELIMTYGFTTYDRVYFPHVTQRYTYGIHKFAVKADFLLQSDKSLTVLGGKILVGLGGAIGGVWSDYTSMLSFEKLEWQTSALAALRINNALGSVLRLGAAQYNGTIRPFVSIDFITKYY